MTRSDELHQHEARLALLRQSQEMLRSGELRPVRAGGVETTAEVIEAVGREMAALEAAVRKLRGEAEPVHRRDGLRGMTPAMAFCLVS